MFEEDDGLCCLARMTLGLNILSGESKSICTCTYYHIIKSYTQDEKNLKETKIKINDLDCNLSDLL